MKTTDDCDPLEKELSQMEAPPPPADLLARCLAAGPAQHRIHRTANPIERLLRRRDTKATGWGKLTLSVGSFTLVCAVVGAILFLTPGTPLRPAPAFSEVEAAMREVRTARWTDRLSLFDLQSRPTHVFTKEAWIRLDPPAFSVRDIASAGPGPAGGTSATVPTSGVHSVMDAQAYFQYNPAAGRYTRIRSWPEDVIGLNNPDPVGAVREYLRNKLILPPSLPASPPEPGLRSNATATISGGGGIDYLAKDTRITPSTWEGRKVYLYESTSLLADRQRLVIRYWADPDTRRIVRREVRLFYAGGSDKTQFLVVEEGFDYDKTPPDGTFHLTPPPGAIVDDIYGSTGAQKPAADHRAIEAAIRASEDGWRRGDFPRFASVWDFGYLDHGSHVDSSKERRQMWKIRTTNQRGRWRQWASDIVSEHANADGTLDVRVRSHGIWADDGSPWHGITEYDLRRHGANNGWRIYDWRHQSLWDRILAEHFGKPRLRKPAENPKAPSTR